MTTTLKIFNLQKRVVLCIGVLVLATTAAFPSPRVVSDQMEEVSAYLFTKKEVDNQSGERIVIDALLFDARPVVSDDKVGTTLLNGEFSLFIPSGSEGKRFCVDLASRTASFRRMAIYKLTKPVHEINAHIEASDTGEIDASGAVMVAFSTNDHSQNPLEACLLQDDWIYPARHRSAGKDPDGLTLQFRINSGNASSTLVQVNEDNVAVGQPSNCTRDEGKNGLFDRLCRIDLFSTASGVARVKIKIRQRSGLPLERVFNVAVSEKAQ